MFSLAGSHIIIYSPSAPAKFLFWKTFKNENCVGAEGEEISYRLLKEAGTGIIGPLTTLFNLSLRLQEVPSEWKCSVISPIFKGGRKNRQDPSRYRPIALTSCIARLMEKLLNIQVLKYLQDNSLLSLGGSGIKKNLFHYPLLSPYQSGFLPNHSTVTQLCFLIHEWQTAVDDGENVQATFLDLSEAYDRLSIIRARSDIKDSNVRFFILGTFLDLSIPKEPATMS